MVTKKAQLREAIGLFHLSRGRISEEPMFTTLLDGYEPNELFTNPFFPSSPSYRRRLLEKPEIEIKDIIKKLKAEII